MPTACYEHAMWQYFFTQDGEITRLETQLQQRQDYIREKVATYIYTYKYITWLI